MSDNKIVIYSRGINGKKTYSIFDDEFNPIITNKDLGKISQNFVRIYPGFSKKIRLHLQDFSGDLPAEVNLNHLDGGARFELIEAISLEFEKNIKNK